MGCRAVLLSFLRMVQLWLEGAWTQLARHLYASARFTASSCCPGNPTQFKDYRILDLRVGAYLWPTMSSTIITL